MSGRGLSAYIVCCTVLSASALAAPMDVKWGRQIGTTSSDLIRGISANDNGMIYVAGTSGGALGGTALGGNDGVLFRLNPINGSTVWSRNIGTNLNDELHGVSVGLNDEAFIAGLSAGSFGAASAGGNDAILASYNSTGTQNWARQFGTSGADIAIGCATDPSGNIHTGGYTTGGLFHSNYGSYDAISISRDNAGNSGFGAQHGTAARDHAHLPAVDSSGATYLTGTGEGALGGGTYQGGWDAFLLKLDNTGTIAWRRPIATTLGDRGEQVAVDSTGCIYVVGLTTGVLGASSFGGEDAFVRKFDPDGNVLWTSQIGTSSNDQGWGIVIDDLDRVHIVGLTGGSLLGMANNGGMDAFVVVYSSAGQIIAKKMIGTSGTETDNVRVAIDAYGDILVATATTGSMYATNSGNTDWAITKLEGVPEPQLLWAAAALVSLRRQIAR